MWGLIGAGIASAAKFGYDEYKRHSNRSEKRDFLDYQNNANYHYYLKSLRESPLAQREGLEAAGYNPMLALGSIGSHSFAGSSSSSGDIDTGGDLVSSAKDGMLTAHEIKKAMKGKIDEDAEQNKIKTKADEKGLGIIDAEKDKIEAETDAIRSQEWRNWVSTVGGITGDATEALLLYDYVKRNVLHKGPYGSRPIGFGANIPSQVASAKAAGIKLAPLLMSTSKGGLASLGLGLGATGIYYGLNNGLQRDSPNKSGYFKRDNDRKSQGGYYPHGNWSR